MHAQLSRSLPVVQRLTTSPFDRFFNEFVNRGWNGQDGEALGTFRPSVDAFETSEGVHFIIDLPGLKKEDIDLTCENGVLTIAGERKLDWDEEDVGLRRAERFHGKFSRGFSLPQGVDMTKIDAQFEDGVLRVLVPKGDQLKAKKVDIR